MLRIIKTFLRLFLFLFNLAIALTILYLIFVLEESHYIKYTITIIETIFIINIIMSEREYYYKILWIFIILFQPVLGLVFYFALGNLYKSKKVYSDKVISDSTFDKLKKYDEDDFKDYGDPYKKIIVNLGKEHLYGNTKQDVMITGKELFNNMIIDIQKAKSFIHLQYYIISDSKLLEYLNELLIQKAKEGVEVRIIYDSIGSNALSNKTVKYLRENNINIQAFGKFKIPFFNSKINFRNHRKITVIDNKVGYIGGNNIADEYLGFSSKNIQWLDLHMRLTGVAIHDLHLTFLKDWFYITKENYIAQDYEKYFRNYPAKSRKREYTQIVSSGPDHKDLSVKNIYFKLIANAQKEVVIYTPYLVPDKDLVQALITAAENKVKIKIFMPGIPDKKMVYAVSHSYYRELLQGGIQIFEIKRSFLHSKALIIDNEIVSLGTINFDFRSFNINFEGTAFTNSKSTITRLNYLTSIYEESSNEITLNQWNNRPLSHRVVENILQLFAPLF